MRKVIDRSLCRAEGSLDSCFGAAANPLRHLGALAFHFLWLIVGTGIYLYIIVDTSVAGAYQSIAELRGWTFGGLVRSLHRYASDAFVFVVMLHLVREWAADRYSGFRWYSWVTGVPLIWMIYASGIGGYWLPWDRLAQFSIVSTAEMIDWFPLFLEPVSRNFQSSAAVSDRFFTLLIFLHIGIPLFTLIASWAHVHRISKVDHYPHKALAWGSVAMLLGLAVVQPAHSGSAADLGSAVTSISLDWFFLFIHPLSDSLGAGPVWLLLGAATLLLVALPWWPHTLQQAVAVVDAANCNGCERCYADCPYGAVTMAPHPDKRNHRIAVVDADYCASCGICVGACPSSTPFRRQEILLTGIDLPNNPINTIRTQLERGIARLSHGPRLVVFGCDHAAGIHALADAATLPLSFECVGVLPPAFVEYSLRNGADGVLITGCREGGCHYRLGNQWTVERIEHLREPHLRRDVPRERVRILWGGAHELAGLKAALADFRATLLAGTTPPLPPSFQRKKSLHGL